MISVRTTFETSPFTDNSSRLYTAGNSSAIFTLQVAVFPLPSLADTVIILDPIFKAVTVHSNPFGEIETFSLFTDHVTDVSSPLTVLPAGAINLSL